MNTRLDFGIAASLGGVLLAAGWAQSAPQLLRDKAFTGKPVGRPEIVGTFSGPVPVGVTVSPAKRVFVSFPRTMDMGAYTLGEWRNGRVVPFPNASLNRLNSGEPSTCLISVQGITVDNKNRLWVLDTGKIMDKPITPGSGAAKLVCINLATNRITKVITFPPNIAGKEAYLNDVRISPFQGKEGTAFISDSSEKGQNAIVVVDLATGTSMRRLADHFSVRSERDFVATVEGQPLKVRKPGQKPANDTTGVDGIALSGDGTRLYYCPNAGHKLFSVSTNILADKSKNETEVTNSIKDLGDKKFASDGIECDAYGRLFLTDYENDAIRIRQTDGTYIPIVRSPTMIWPDSIAIVPGGDLYFTSNQLNRRKQFHNGKDMRVKPYVIYRVRVNNKPQAVGWRGK